MLRKVFIQLYPGLFNLPNAIRYKYLAPTFNQFKNVFMDLTFCFIVCLMDSLEVLLVKLKCPLLSHKHSKTSYLCMCLHEYML